MFIFIIRNMEGGSTDILQLLDLETSFSQENAAGHTSLPGNLSKRTKTPDFFYQCTVSRNSDLSFIFTIIHVLFEIFEPCFFHGLLTIYLLECLSSFEVEMRLIQNQERNKISNWKSEIHSNKTETSKLLGCGNRKAQLIPEQVDFTGWHCETTENLQSNTDIV